MRQVRSGSLQPFIQGTDMPAYKVQAGDTLGKIAKKFYGDASQFSAIVAANSIRNPDKLKVGQERVDTVEIWPSDTGNDRVRGTIFGPLKRGRSDRR